MVNCAISAGEAMSHALGQHEHAQREGHEGDERGQRCASHVGKGKHDHDSCDGGDRELSQGTGRVDDTHDVQSCQQQECERHDSESGAQNGRRRVMGSDVLEQDVAREDRRLHWRRFWWVVGRVGQRRRRHRGTRIPLVGRWCG